MDEKYISVTKFKESLAKLTVEGGTEATRATIARTLGKVVPQLLDDELFADVQPVNQWISVKERFPDEDGWYLVCKHDRVRVAEWCKDCWYNESDLPIDDCAITHWQPLPEPPKDGDTNGRVS